MEYTQVSFRNPAPNGLPEITDEMKDFIAIFEEMENLHNQGKPIFVEFVSGDRKGSIARFVPEVKTGKDGYGHPLKTFRYDFRRKSGWHFNDPDLLVPEAYVSGVYRWDGRSNKPQAALPYNCSEVVYLRGYEGPTVWKLFDAKAAKEKLLENPDQRDVDGNVLCVGDEVIYVNLRYGTGATLERGVVDRFDAAINSRGHTVYTVLKNLDGMESRTEHPETLVMKA